jgi:hypothetical protein
MKINYHEIIKERMMMVYDLLCFGMMGDGEDVGVYEE